MNEQKVIIPCGQASKLWLYSDFTVNGLAYAANPDEWRKLTGRDGNPLRVVVNGSPLPHGYTVSGQGLAFDGIERD